MYLVEIFRRILFVIGKKNWWILFVFVYRVQNTIRAPTCVSAFVEILQSLQCKIFKYTFFGQYPMKFWDFFSLCKISHPVWLQLDHKKLGPSELRFFRPLYPKTERKKTLFQMRYTALKNINQDIYWILNVSR